MLNLLLLFAITGLVIFVNYLTGITKSGELYIIGVAMILSVGISAVFLINRKEASLISKQV